uniref:Endonuclease/exonuclease/phosphatase domain-containing protein n=1 Tax=Cacopsylla melanoneura TaxID=428564 RepID=A0A8D9BL53_9HEMI
MRDDNSHHDANMMRIQCNEANNSSYGPSRHNKHYSYDNQNQNVVDITRKDIQYTSQTNIVDNTNEAIELDTSVNLEFGRDTDIGQTNNINFNFKILHMNIGGIQKKTFELSESCIDRNVDIIAVTEHWLMAGEELLINVDNYKLASIYHRKKQIRGGSCIFVKNNIEYVELNNVKEKTIEGLCECTGIYLPHYNTYVLSIYRPPKTSNLDKTTFFQTLEEIMNILQNKYCDTILVAGDFNFDLLKQDDPSVREIKCAFLKYNCINSITRIPTRIQFNHDNVSRTLIDNIYVNCKDFVVEVVDLKISDHTAQIISIDVRINSEKQIPKYIKTEKRKFTEENLDNIKNMLSKINWNLLDNEETEDAYNTFYNILLKCINEVCPKKITKTEIKTKQLTLILLRVFCWINNFEVIKPKFTLVPLIRGSWREGK